MIGLHLQFSPLVRHRAFKTPMAGSPNLSDEQQAWGFKNNFPSDSAAESIYHNHRPKPKLLIENGHPSYLGTWLLCAFWVSNLDGA